MFNFCFIIVACKNVTCGLHQWCTLQDNKPTCHCKDDCVNVSIPVCGLTNGIEYRNPCELKKEECQTQIKIKFLPGPCESMCT